MKVYIVLIEEEGSYIGNSNWRTYDVYDSVHLTLESAQKEVQYLKDEYGINNTQIIEDKIMEK